MAAPVSPSKDPPLKCGGCPNLAVWKMTDGGRYCEGCRVMYLSAVNTLPREHRDKLNDPKLWSKV